MKTRTDPNDRLSIAAGAPAITTMARAGGAAGRVTSLPPTMEETDVCEHLDTHGWIGALRPQKAPRVSLGRPPVAGRAEQERFWQGIAAGADRRVRREPLAPQERLETPGFRLRASAW